MSTTSTSTPRRSPRSSGASTLDLEDVRRMIERGLVEPVRLRELYEQIEPELYRYPAIDPPVFRRKVEAALG